MKEAEEVIQVDTSQGPLKSNESYAPLTLKNQKGQWLCGSLKSDGQTICVSPFVMNNGRCKVHGGPAKVTTGLYRNPRSKSLKKRIEELKGNPSLLDLRQYIAATVALLEEALDNMESVELDPLEKAKAVGMISNNLARIIETKHKIEVGHWLSPERVQRCIEQGAEIIRRQCASCGKLPALADEFQSQSVPE